jgi:hypothetical protein
MIQDTQKQHSASKENLIVITDEDIKACQPAEISVGESDLFQLIHIKEPLDGSQTATQTIDIKGEAEPNIEITLECNNFHSGAKSNAKGFFVFKNIPLASEWNDIELQVLQYPAISTTIQVFRQKRILFEGLKDPYSQSTLGPNDEVVRCRKCKTFARLDSWNALPGCAQHRCNGKQYWTRNENDFFLEDKEIKL